jgi:hypothetical protein
MSNIKLTREQFRDLCCEDYLEGFEIVEEGDWELDYKWQHKEMIVKEVATGKFYCCTISRSGSPYPDYYYSYEDGGTDLVEVEQVEETRIIKTWKAV